MDTVTHVLIGSVIGETGLVRKTTGWGKTCGIICSAFPDIDMVFGILGTEFVVNYHRSITNSIFLIGPFSIILALIFNSLSGKKNIREFFLICALQISVHIFLDLITSYGSMIFWPISKKRLFLDWLFIIDPYFSSIPITAIIAMCVFKKNRIHISRISIILCSLYIIFCALNHHSAIRIGNSYAQNMGLKKYDIGAIPQPLSPFFWDIFIRTEDKIFEGYVDLAGRQDQSDEKEGILKWFTRRYMSPSDIRFVEWSRNKDSIWIKKAINLKGVKDFFQFARYPISTWKKTDSGTYRVKFFDLRFLNIKGYRPFQYVVEYGPDGTLLWHGYIKRRF